jgi:signal transduction histidine kinase
MEKKILKDFIEKNFPIIKNLYRNASIGNYLHGIVHNLNGSLQIITMQIEMLEMILEKEKNFPSALPQLKKSMDQVEILKNALEILVRKSEIEYDKGPKPIRVNEILEEQIHFFQNNLFFKHNVKINKIFKSRIPNLQGHPFDFSEAISNFIQNSIEALEKSPEKELTFITDRIDTHIRITVKDTGCGIREEIQSKIFEPFFTTKPESHLGLGLFIARKLLKRYQTSIQFSSKEGETIFSLSIPILKS